MKMKHKMKKTTDGWIRRAQEINDQCVLCVFMCGQWAHNSFLPFPYYYFYISSSTGFLDSSLCAVWMECIKNEQKHIYYVCDLLLSVELWGRKIVITCGSLLFWCVTKASQWEFNVSLVDHQSKCHYVDKLPHIKRTRRIYISFDVR